MREGAASIDEVWEDERGDDAAGGDEDRDDGVTADGQATDGQAAGDEAAEEDEAAEDDTDEGEDATPASLSGWALAAAVIALAVSFFVGWGLPIGIVAAITAVLALRRPVGGRVIGWWALALALLSIVYSAGWLIWAVTAGAA